MKKVSKKRDIKKVTRLATFGVAMFALAILVATGWFIMRSLGDVSVAKTTVGQKTLKIEGVNTPLLEKIQKFIDDKKADDRRLGQGLGNPFKRTPQPAPVEPVPPPPTPPAEGTPPAT